jgi:hypothetical protein
MSDTLQRLQAANPGLRILPIDGPEFRHYGTLLRRYDPTEIIERARSILPMSGEPCAFNQAMQREVYGDMPVQVGWCYGQNLQMAGLEYHKGAEVNVCITDVVLLVGHVQDVVIDDEGATYDTAQVAAFYAPAGNVVELPAWNLHFAPIHVRVGEQFATLVYLPRGTNEALIYDVPAVGENRLLFAVNKWLLVHPDAKSLVEQGAYPGLVGDDIFVTPV